MFSAEDFPNRFDHAEAQTRLYAMWEQKGYFHSEPDPNRTPFTIVIPPPNVTGALHLGHALNNTLQDILIRWKRMQGYNTLWMPGADHAGIATQAVVERRLKEESGLTRHDLGRDKLVERIWEWKDEYETRIVGQLKRLGCSCDWQRFRFTLDPVCARAVRQTFFDLFRKQLIYRGKRLVNWDTFLQTAVSDDEVFHKETKGHFWHFRYPVIDPQPGEPAFVTIATTRPETMLGDTAVAVHPAPARALQKAREELEEKLAKAPVKEQAALQQQIEALAQRGQEMLPRLEQLRDMALDGRKVMLPLLEREIPLIVDVWAKPELGSGCVKITPAHDPNDYEVGMRAKLPMINILQADGLLNENAGDYEGLTMKAARKQVVADLEQAGLLGDVEDRLIDLAHSDRSKTPIEPRLADQWFVKMEQLAQSAIDPVADGRIKILPARYAKGYIDWLAEKRDWPVSRQLWWGHQIPIWSLVCQDAKTHQQRVSALEQDPAVLSGSACFQTEPDLERAAAVEHDNTVQGAKNVKLPYATIHVCPQEDDAEFIARLEAQGYVREEDVLDTWFSSALWPHSTLGWPEKTPELAYYYPTSTLITSRDIITLWVARMVLAGLNNQGEIPFREVFIHPKILDGYGETMSKSKGNGVDPSDVIDKFGADALRFGIAHLTTETQDVRMPVQFECPHCETPIEQTKKNRELPRIECPKCKQPFSTQWARTEQDRALPRGAVVAERFELGRNFCNKLWNASRFALINLGEYAPDDTPDAALQIEDRWILSRLATVTREVNAALAAYRYSDAARALYEFAWDDFCSFYVEMVKGRLPDAKEGPVARRVLTTALDNLLRLLHPIMPFITEEVWRLLGQVAPARGLPVAEPASEDLITAAYPVADEARIDLEIEARFERFQAVLGALRETRSRQNIAPSKPIDFVVRCDEETTSLLQPMTRYFKQMANAHCTACAPDAQAPKTNSPSSLPGIDMYVDLEGLIDFAAEREKLNKQEENLLKLIQSKEKKLANASFVERAPEAVVAKERDNLSQSQRQLESVREALENLPA